MSVKSIELNKEKDSVIVEFEFKGEKWDKIFSDTKADKIKNLKVDGFRPGKAPKHIVDKHVTPIVVAYESINKAYETFFDEIFKEVQKEYKYAVQSAHLLDAPVLGENSTTVRLVFPLLPDMSVIKIDKSIKTKIEKLSVSSKEIDEYMKAQISKNALNFPLKKGDKTKLGDTVTIKYKGYVNNEPFDGGEADEFDLKLGSKTFIGTFEEQLVDKKIGWKGQVNVKFPDEYAVPTLKGQPAVFDCEILDAKRPEEVVLTDEAVVDLHIPNVKNIEQFKEYTKDLLNVLKYFENEDKAIDSLIKEFKEKHKFVAADVLVKVNADKKLEETKAELKKQSIKFDEYLDLIKLSEKDFYQQVIKEEKEHLISVFIFTELLKQYGSDLKLQDEDWQTWMVSLSLMQPQLPLAFLIEYVKGIQQRYNDAVKENKPLDPNIEKMVEEIKHHATSKLILQAINKEVAVANSATLIKVVKKQLKAAEKELEEMKKEADKKAEEAKKASKKEEVVEPQEAPKETTKKPASKAKSKSKPATEK
ncbi:trigger factor [Mycoplasmopsis primatum]|uniref:trigger factor n=1 Tax=Mycoplasmopsis primatum TaxID=55604 RepID=UPI0009FC53C8|nr:trigger factor [Mycoplasmopsis primatum]